MKILQFRAVENAKATVIFQNHCVVLVGISTSGNLIPNILIFKYYARKVLEIRIEKG